MGEGPPKPAFLRVKALVSHQVPAGALSKNPFFSSAVPSSQANLAFGPDISQTTQSMDMASLQKLYPDIDSEPMFSHPTTADPALFVSYAAPEELPLDQQA